MTGPQIARLPDGRLHLHHGPIDIILSAEGPGAAGAEALGVARFRTVLQELVNELPDLRSSEERPLHGLVARSMAAAVAPFRPDFITPMAAVAGAVADTVLQAALTNGGITRAYANNGGDIALHSGAGAGLRHGHRRPPRLAGPDHHPPRRRHRRHRHKRLAGAQPEPWDRRCGHRAGPDCRQADAAATMIANAVDLPGHPAITRVPAREVKADSDLGDLPVTVGVGALTMVEATEALDRGAAFARDCLRRGLIAGAALFLHPADPRIIGALTLEPAHV